MKGRVVGIDLGTTKSCVAVVEDGTPVTIPNRGGYKTTPSVVAIAEDGKRLVGHIAKRQAITNAENTVYAAKRLIGRRWRPAPSRAPIEAPSYPIAPGPEGDVRVRLRDRVYSIPEISALILQEMKRIGEEYLGEEVEKVVVAVPAHFHHSQRQATVDAGRIAGLDIIRLIHAPSAAALAAYRLGRPSGVVAVYDMGGGGFDISLVAIQGGVFEVIAAAGDSFLGGEAFDKRVIDWLVLECEKRRGVSLRADKMALPRLRDAAERAKCELSTARETEIQLSVVPPGGRGEDAVHLRATLSRSKLEELTETLVGRSIWMCRRALDDAGISADQIEEVVLVGGMTLMPRVRQAATEFFGVEPRSGVNPDEVVALGAAIHAAALMDDKNHVRLVDVTPHALTVQMGDRSRDLVEPNTAVPVRAPYLVRTDGRAPIELKVLEGGGDRVYIEHRDLVGELVLTPRVPPGEEVDVEVTFAVSADGLVGVRAVDVATGAEQPIATSAGGLREAEICAMIEANQDYMVEVRSVQEFEKRRHEAQRTLEEIDRLWAQVSEIIGGSDFGRGALAKARAACERARQAIAAKDPRQLEDASEWLGRTLNMFRGVVSKTRVG